MTYYIYDNQNIIAEYDQNGKQTASYTHGPNIDEPLSAEIRDTRIYYHADGLGSITTLTNHMGHKVQQYNYDSFGNIKFTPFPHWIKQPYTFTGREFDYETGLYYYRARYYDAQVGRFVTKDPIGFEGGINQYSYVGNNPLNKIDPNGESAKACVRRFAFGPIAYLFPPRHCYVIFNDDYTDTLSYDGSVGDDSAPYTWFKRCHKIEPKDGCDSECTDVQIRQSMMKCSNQKYKFFDNNCCDCVRSALQESGCKVPLGITITNLGF